MNRASLCRVQSQEAVCDDVTRKLVGAITTWHDIHSNLLRLSIGNGFADLDAARFSISNPELTSIQIKHMFPDLSEHWRYV
ncbi:hypothetical protein Q1695_012698 [Nippostrongylus brasiliensis]|nr:hypothetical protein Q1695_012698 [Nippostrongylus brasiliensis]